MIISNNIANENIAAASMRSSTRPINVVKSIPNSNDGYAKDCENAFVDHEQYSVRLAKIQVRLIASLMFAFLPGLTQVPTLARSDVPVVVSAGSATRGVPSIAPAFASGSSSSQSLDPSELLSRRRSMDAARLILDDYGGKNNKRPKLPGSVKKQMDMQDRRLSLCQDLSIDAWDWEQCFFYGTNGASGGALYFDGGDLVENSAKTSNAKSKIPTW